MAKQKLTTELSFDNSKALRAAKRTKKAARDVGKEGRKSGEQTSRGMDDAAAATSGFGKQLIGLGLAMGTLAAVRQAVDWIVQSYNRAIQLRDQFAAGAAGANRAIAGSAAQYNVPEPQMRKLLAQIGGVAGAGPQDIRSLSNLMTAMGSAGMVSGVTAGPAGGAAQMSPADRAKMVQVATWQQRTGTQGQSAALTKLVAGIQGAQPGTTVGSALGLLETGYKQSLMSDWGEYLQGASTGTLGLMALGIAPDVALSEYAAQAKYAASGVRAAETYRMVQERFVIADDPKVVKEVDRRYGSGTYWKLKKSDPTRLQQLIMGVLTGSEGRQQAALFKRLGVAPEMGGRIARLKAGRVGAAGIRTAMGVAGPSTPRDIEWRSTSPRAEMQAGGMVAGEIGFAKGDTTSGNAALRAIAAEERKLWESESPWGYGITNKLATEYEMDVKALKRYVRRKLKAAGQYTPEFEQLEFGDPYNFSEKLGLHIPGEGFGQTPAGAAAIRQTQIILNSPGVQYNLTPRQMSDAPDTPQGRAISGGAH